MVQTHKVRKDDVLALLQSSMTYQVGEYQIRFRGEYENQNYYQVNLIPYKTNSNLELLLKF